MTVLHQRLLSALDLDEEDNHPGFSCRSLAALRAVVELHAPVESPFVDLGFVFECNACSPGDKYASIEYPCSTVRRIAEELGVETP